MKVYDELIERGLIAQTTNEEEVKNLIDSGKATFYIGFDPTADSLHVGHFMALCLMKRLQEAGNKPIALVGGGTGMIGDPSGRQDLRTMMTVETIDKNCECFKKQMSNFIDFSDGKALMVNNALWLRNLNYIEFIRDIGALFSVNKMLSAECYKIRMANEGQGLTFLEFNYMIMQAYDFMKLYEEYNCNMQLGGDDQWSNMLAGIDLIHKKLKKTVHAMTINLLLNSEGKKMGKTQKGAVWLDRNKTTPYEFYQYWRNVQDADVIKCLKLLTFLPLEEIHELEKYKDEKINEVKVILAYELTKMIHGEEEATKCKNATSAIFSGNMEGANIPELKLTEDDFVDDNIEVTALLVKSKLCQSKSDARRTIEQGGVLIDDEKVLSVDNKISKGKLQSKPIIMKKGKKNFIKIVLSLVFLSFF